MSSEPPTNVPSDALSETLDVSTTDSKVTKDITPFNLLDLPIELIGRICSTIPLFERRTRKDSIALTNKNLGLDEWEYRVAKIPEPRQDLSNLRLTCHFMNEIVEPIIFSDLIFHFAPQRVSRSSKALIGDLERMAAGTHPACNHIKSLYVVELAIVGISKDGTLNEVGDTWRQNIGDDEDVEAAEKRMEDCLEMAETVVKYFPKAIANMKSLERVAIIVKDDIDASYTPHVLNCMKDLPLLEEIVFSGNHAQTHHLEFKQLAMNNFTHLRRVDIDGFSFQDPDSMITRHMSDMFATANLWTHVKLNDFGGLALVDVMKALEPAQELSHLHLQLFDMKIKPHLPLNYSRFISLSSLTLISRDDPVDPSFWKGLKTERIRLRSLRTDGLSYEVFEYLTSYTGLQRLQIDMYNTVPYFRPTDDELEKLVLAALDVQSVTLENLQINVNPAAYRGMWFGSMFRNHIKMCPNLLEYGGTFLCNNFQQEVEEFINTMVTGPRRWIEHLTVFCSHTVTKVERPPGISASPKIYQSALAARWLAGLEIQDPRNYPEKVEFRAIATTFKLLFEDGAYRYLLLPDSHPEGFQSKHAQWLQNPYHHSLFLQQ